MNQISKEWLDFLRQQYPQGRRIKLQEMKDPYCPVEPGTMGTLERIDDIGTFHVKWDNGQGLGLVLGEDRFTVLLPPPVQTLKLYMPMTVGYFDEEESLEEITMDSRKAAEYAPQITAALASKWRWLESKGPEAVERSFMAYYHIRDHVDTSVNQKVQSYHFTAEARDERLWGIAECKVQGELTPLELERLIEAITGQASDGFGEIFEQHEIAVNEGQQIYVHLWQSEDWSIMPERDRFDPHFSERLPDLCFSVHPDDGTLISITKGAGYEVSEDSSERPGQNRHMADYRNRCRGISQAQAQAMLNGCLHGWDSPAASPSAHEQAPFQMGAMQQ